MAVKGFVCFCPDLKLYRYRMNDESLPEKERDVDHKFTDQELEDSLVQQLANGQESEAKFLASMTGLARVNPHKIVTFDTALDDIVVLEPADHWAQQEKQQESE